MLISGFASSGGIVALGAAANASVKALQAAVRALGQRVGNGTLQIKPDGVMGPKTAAAVNLAFSKYLTNAPAQYRTGRLTQAEITTMSSLLVRYVGVTPTVAKAAAKTTAAAKTAVKSVVHAVKSPQIKALQTAVHALGVAVKDKTLQIVADGFIGPKTIGAVNRAMVKYATNAPASLRQGNITQAEIVQGAETLTRYIGGLSAVRGVHPAAVAAKAAPTAKQSSKAIVTQLQQALVNLGQLVDNSTLTAVAADGIMGPKTAAAVNLAFTQYIAAAYAPPALRTGRLSTTAVASNARQILDLINRENVRRAGAAAPESMPAEVTQAAEAAESQVAAESAQEQAPDAVPGAAASPQAAAQAVIAQQQQQASVPAEYTPPGQLAPAGGGGGGGDMAPMGPDDVAPYPGGEAPAAAGGGFWANLPTAGKVAIGVGGVGLLGLLAYALTRKGGGAAARFARRRYA